MNTSNPVIACIGLGKMGQPMATNLVRRDFVTFGFDPNNDPSATIGGGFHCSASAADACTRADVVILSLPTERILEQVLLGPNGIPSSSLHGKVVIDTTTTTVSMAQRIAATLAAQHCAFLDSPVTGGVSGAENGTLSIMIGGETAAFERCRNVYSALGTNIVHVGPSGHGQAAKMVNQMLMAAIYSSVAEGFAFAAQLGVDVAKIYEAVENGGAQSKMLTAIKPNLLAGVTHQVGNVTQHGKDLDYVMDEANRRALYLPITSAVHGFYNLARSLGFGEIWSGEMWAVWEKLLNIDLTATIQSNAAPEP